MDLNKFLRSDAAQNGLTEPVAATILLQVERALKVMHQEAGMLHLDIKPANILLQPHTWHAYLTDMGLAQDIGARPRSSTVATHQYRPPEVFAHGDLTKLDDKQLLVLATDG